MNSIAIWLNESWPYLGIAVTFVALILWVYRPGARRRYKTDGNIPFAPGKGTGKKGPVNS